MEVMDFEIQPVQVQELRQQGTEFLLLDCREPWEHQTARIEGAVLMPMQELPLRAHQELDPDQHIVVYCHHGVRSLNVTNWLRQQGFEKVQSMRGGIAAWSKEVDPKVPSY
jgi:rhodanese-related sulfurtransferase